MRQIERKKRDMIIHLYVRFNGKLLNSKKFFNYNFFFNETSL